MLGVVPSTFSFYINGMYTSSNQMRFVHFADDTTVFASDSDIKRTWAQGSCDYVNFCISLFNFNLLSLWCWEQCLKISDLFDEN